MPVRAPRLSQLVVAFLILAGCKKGVPQTGTFAAAKVGTSNTLIYHDDSGGGHEGDAIIARKPGEVVVGHERFARPDRDIQHFYRGAAAFDLRPISSLPSKVLDHATLTYKLHQTISQTIDGKTAALPNTITCADQLLIATSDWQKAVGAGEVTDALFTGRPFAALPSAAPGGFEFSVDITTAARQWMLKPEENFGILLKGADEKDGTSGNDACATSYGDFSLHIDYTEFK